GPKTTRNRCTSRGPATRSSASNGRSGRARTRGVYKKHSSPCSSSFTSAIHSTYGRKTPSQPAHRALRRWRAKRRIDGRGRRRHSCHRAPIRLDEIHSTLDSEKLTKVLACMRVCCKCSWQG